VAEVHDRALHESQQVLVRNRQRHPRLLLCSRQLEVPRRRRDREPRFVPLTSTKPKVPAPRASPGTAGCARQKRGLFGPRSRRRHAHRGSCGPRAAAAADAVPPASGHTSNSRRPTLRGSRIAPVPCPSSTTASPELRDSVVPVLGPGRRRLGCRRKIAKGGDNIIDDDDGG
jgi:hypothetical protein